MSKTTIASNRARGKTRPGGLGPKASLMIFGLLLVALLNTPPVWADVVELQNGQRVEGTFKGADDSAVKIEVGGQVITFKPEQVRAIHLGAAPVATPGQLSPRDEALRALKALQSVTTGGTSYRDYAPRVSDAKIVVDRYLSAVHEAPERSAIADAMGFYTLAGSVWSAQVSKSNYQTVGGSPMIERCLPLKQKVEDLERALQTSKFRLPSVSPRGETPDRQRELAQAESSRGIAVVTVGGVSISWGCASAQISEAEKLLAGDKK